MSLDSFREKNFGFQQQGICDNLIEASDTVKRPVGLNEYFQDKDIDI